jgi:hypothetical protein
MARTAQIEKSLMDMNMERNVLESELGKMGQSSGRTISERNRKAFVEARVEELAREMSSMRMRLKNLPL